MKYMFDTSVELNNVHIKGNVYEIELEESSFIALLEVADTTLLNSLLNINIKNEYYENCTLIKKYLK